jgi:hypothetical protein
MAMKREHVAQIATYRERLQLLKLATSEVVALVHEDAERASRAVARLSHEIPWRNGKWPDSGQS